MILVGLLFAPKAALAWGDLGRLCVHPLKNRNGLATAVPPNFLGTLPRPPPPPPGTRGVHPGRLAGGHHARGRGGDHRAQPRGERRHRPASPVHPLRAQHLPLLVRHVEPPGPGLQPLRRGRRSLRQREGRRRGDFPRHSGSDGGLDNVARREGTCVRLHVCFTLLLL